jgi:hypothetical protein
LERMLETGTPVERNGIRGIQIEKIERAAPGK